jgi:hypothetical protein
VIRAALAASGLGLALFVPGPAWAQDAPLPPGAEGPLRNDVFLPVSTARDEALAAGDAALTESRAVDDPESSERALVAALESWREALLIGSGEAGVAAGDPRAPEALDGVDFGPAPARVLEGVESALLRRLAGLLPEEEARWRERTEPLAGSALSAAGNRPRALAAVERLHPRTDGAARAALRLADQALEAGRRDAAAAWAARGSRHATDPRLLAAFELRAAAAAPPARPDRTAGWRSGTRLVAAGQLDLHPAQRSPFGRRRDATFGGVNAGLVRLADGRLAVQTPIDVFLVTQDADGDLARGGSFDPYELVSGVLGPLPPLWFEADRMPPGWPLEPATDGRDLVLVLGRTQRSDEPNALAVVQPPPPPGAALQPPLPKLRWAVQGDRIARAGDAEATPHPALAPLAAADVQPGPVVVGERVVALFRTADGESEAWLAAFELATGEPAWLRFLARGTPVTRDLGRLQGRQADQVLRRASPPPLALHSAAGAALFVDTGLGAASLVDLVDGRLDWSFRSRRRRGSARGWTGWRPLHAPDGPGPGGVLWAPADSDRLYRLVPAPLASPGDPLWAAPRAIGEATALLGGERGAEVVLGRAGARLTVSERRADGRRLDALWLGPGEQFRGPGLCSARRVAACSDRGLYLFDREQELLLLDYAPLPGLPSGTSVGLADGGDDIFVLGDGSLWAFRVP